MQLGAIATLAAGGLLLSAGPAAAAEIQLSPPQVAPNGQVLITGEEYIPNDTVNVTVVAPDGATITQSFTSDGAGQFGGMLSLPEGGSVPGTYDVTATGTTVAFQATATFLDGAPVPAPAAAPMPAPAVAPAPAAPMVDVPAQAYIPAPSASGHFVEWSTGTPDLNVPTPADDATATSGDLASGIDPTQSPLPSELPALGASEAGSAVVTSVTGAE
jgi:hypothetical protein